MFHTGLIVYPEHFNTKFNYFRYENNEDYDLNYRYLYLRYMKDDIKLPPMSCTSLILWDCEPKFIFNNLKREIFDHVSNIYLFPIHIILRF